MSEGCNRAINLAIICFLGVALYRCRQERKKVDCPSDDRWLSKHGTVYVPHNPISIFSEEYTEWKTLATNALGARRILTVILDCPNNKTTNYSVTELAAALASTKRTILSDKDANTGPDLWLRHSFPEENLPHNNDECAKIAEIANHMHSGTVQGIIVTDQVLWNFAEGLFLANKTTAENIWESVELETLVHWKRHGLMTAFMITNPLLCMGIGHDFPSSILQQFKRAFFLEHPSCLKIEDHPLPILTESRGYQSCWISLRDKFLIDLVLPMPSWRLHHMNMNV